MIIKSNPNFDKDYRKRIKPNKQLDHQFRKRLDIFVNNPGHPLLHDHKLKGNKKELRSFSITGDIRVVYRMIDSETIELLEIGSHNQVY